MQVPQGQTDVGKNAGPQTEIMQVITKCKWLLIDKFEAALPDLLTLRADQMIAKHFCS